MKKYSAPLRLVPLAIALVCSGCAGALPTLELESARSSIRNAERANAQQYAPELFNRATDRIAKAEVLMESNRNQRARRLIELADAEAQLAEAISEAEHSEAAIESLANTLPVSAPAAAAALAAPPAESAPRTVVYTNNIDE